ncbi:MAG: MGMT family protein [Patescibacteria group bacterium]|jgi:methylated-DNA-[protein]-cysteine S-methyltransferase
MMTDFQARVLAVVKCIPKGQVLSYKEVAARAGSPGAYRAVGSVMKNNHDLLVPCHRVIKSNGEPGGYNGGEKEKELRLISENAKIDRDKNIKYTIVRR